MANFNDLELYEGLLNKLDSLIGNQLSNLVSETDSFPEKVILSIYFVWVKQKFNTNTISINFNIIL